MCRCIAVANLVHDALTDRSPVESLRRLYTRASQWFQMDAPTVDSIVKRVGTGVKEMSRLFNLDTGAFANVDDVLGHAEVQQKDLETIDAKATSEAGMSALLTTDSRSDPVTGALVRGEFDGAVKRAFHEGAGSGWITTLAYFAIDHFKQIITDHGVEAGDDALVDVASVLMKHFEPLGGAVCRISNDVFAAALATPDLASAVRALEATQTVLATPRAQGSHITVSFGVAHAPSIAGEPIKSESELVVAGTRALHKARQQVPAPLSRNRLAA